jgi:hypothetical protein
MTTPVDSQTTAGGQQSNGQGQGTAGGQETTASEGAAGLSSTADGAAPTMAAQFGLAAGLLAVAIF